MKKFTPETRKNKKSTCMLTGFASELFCDRKEWTLIIK